MLLDRLDVPAYGPQTMAFPVSREKVTALRVALRALFEKGDMTAYTRLWDALVPSYLAQKAEARWVVPSSTIEQLCVHIERALPASATRTVALAQTRAWLGNSTEVRVHPEAWFRLEQARSYDARCAS